MYKFLKCLQNPSGSLSLKTAEPPNSLQKGGLLSKYLDRFRGVDPHAKSMGHTVIEVDLVQGANVQEQGLQLGPQRRRHQCITILALTSAYFVLSQPPHIKFRLTSCSYTRWRSNRANLFICPSRRMCSTCHVGLECPRQVSEAERVSAAEAVTRDSKLAEVEAVLHKVYRSLDDGIGNVGIVSC